MSSTLFSEFSSADKQTWLTQVSKDLKGADIQPVIQWEFEKGLQAEALLFPNEVGNFEYQQILANPNPNFDTQVWRNRMEIVVTDEKIANTIALEGLNQGIDEIVFLLDEKMTKTVDFDSLLNTILLPYCAISFEIVGEITDEIINEKTTFLDKYTAYVSSQNYDFQVISGSISENISTKEVLTSNLLTTKLGIHFKTLVLKPSNPAQENSEQLADILQQLTAILAKAADKKQVFEALQIEITVKSLFFVEIAKLRALRLLLLQVSSMYGVEMQAHEFTIHVKTSLQSVANMNQNLLSNTTQAMSAIIGGCNILTITPHSNDKPAFAARIARNVSNLLKEESYFDKVVDAANGSYYIEQLTDKIAEAAWKNFEF
jgi:methylmalonyl-CoA mutase